MKFPLHHPLHIFADNRYYFITAATHNKQAIFKNEETCTVFDRTLFEKCALFSIGLFAWVLLPDHYHTLIEVAESARLPEFFRHLHGPSAYEVTDSRA